MDTWTREFVAEMLKMGRLAYTPLTGWQIGHELAPGDVEWFSIIAEHAELVESVAKAKEDSC